MPNPHLVVISSCVYRSAARFKYLKFIACIGFKHQDGLNASTRLQSDIAWGGQLSDLPTFATNSLVNSPTSLEKSRSVIQGRSPLDRHPPPHGEQESPSQARLQEIGGGKPWYSMARSIISNVAVITTPSAEPTIAGDSPLPSSSSGQAAALSGCRKLAVYALVLCTPAQLTVLSVLQLRDARFGGLLLLWDCSIQDLALYVIFYFYLQLLGCTLCE